MVLDEERLDLDAIDLDDPGDIHAPAALRRRSDACIAIHERLTAVVALARRPGLPLLRARNRAAVQVELIEGLIAQEDRYWRRIGHS